MRSLRSAAVCLLIGAGCAFVPMAEAQVPAPIHVSPDGNDAGDGGIQAPLRTLQRAQGMARQRRRAMPQLPVTVLLHGGVYELPATLLFTPEDSGDVRYAAHPGERPVISGGTRIRGWQRADQSTWMAELPAELAAKPPRRLYVDGLRRTLARTPNSGEYFRVLGPPLAIADPATGEEVNPAKRAFVFKEGDLRAWPRLQEINAVVMKNWESAILPIQSVDEATRMVVFRGPMKWAMVRGSRYYVEGFREALDAPGEWWVDREKGVLYYRPLPGEDMEKARVVAPRLAQLVVMKGEPAAGRYVEGLTFEGLTFAHTDNPVPDTGHSDWQAAVTIPAAIQADGTRKVQILRCDVRNIGWYGIWFRRGCSENRIEQCELRDLGAGGVRIGDQGRQKGTNATHHNTVHNNFIHDGSTDYYGAIPLWVGQASDNRLTHNEICDFNYTGISVGWSWGFAETTCHRNEIAWNHLHHLGRNVLYDMAAIYTLGISTGTTIHHNHIHHIWGFVEGYGAGGIYPDEGSSGLLIENNLVYLTQNGGLTVHYGKENMVRNNIFALGQRSQIHLGRADKGSSQTLLNNIIYYSEGGLYQRMSELHTGNNLYWHTDGPEAIEFPGALDLAGWQKKGNDAGSVVADPLFVNPKAFDFRLRPESPALGLGFKPFDIAAAGLVGADWRARATAIKRQKLDRLPEKERIAQPPLHADMEGMALGKPPSFGTVYGKTPTAGITVSDQQAAGGTRSLRFQDGPEVKQSYNPHLYYGAGLIGKHLAGSFDLFLEPGAVFTHQWRYGIGSFVGGVTFQARADGKATVNDTVICATPAGTWLHVEMAADMRNPALKTCWATVTVAGKPIAKAEAKVTTRFKAMDWVVFVSDATVKTGFYLDNIVLEAKNE